MLLTTSTKVAIRDIKAALENSPVLHLVTNDFTQVTQALQEAYFKDESKTSSNRYIRLQNSNQFLLSQKVLYVFPNQEDKLSIEDYNLLLEYQVKYDIMRASKENPPPCCVVICAKNLKIPSALENHVARIEFPPLKQEDFIELLASYTGQPKQKLDDWANWYLQQMPGFSELEIKNIFSRICYGENGSKRLLDKRLANSVIMKEKIKRLKIHNKLRLISAQQTVVGMEKLKKWLDLHKTNIIRTDTRDSDLLTKGILLLGLPGTGKSLAARSTSQKLGLPLVKLSMSDVLDMYEGESEKNMVSIQDDLSRYCAPCVLWIDEVEKLFSGVGNKDNNGVTDRVFGELLGFLSDLDRSVFTIATANQIDSLPPEFFRPGRFSTIFSLMLPSFEECVIIMEDKLKKHLEIENRELAKKLVNICANVDKKNPSYVRFCTGAVINDLVGEMAIQVTSTSSDKSDEIICETMRKVAKNGRFTVDSRNPETLEFAAKSYLMTIKKSAQSANSGKPLFDLEHFQPREAVADHPEKWDYFTRRPKCVTIDQKHYDTLTEYDRYMFHWIGNTMDIILSSKNNPTT